MAVIGSRYCYHNGNSCGHIQNVNVSYNFKELGRLKKNRKVIDTASISITSVGDHDNSIFETSGPLRWCTTEMVENEKTVIFCNVLENVTLHRPNDESSSETESIDPILESIEGESWYCPEGVTKYPVPDNDYAKALLFCQTGSFEVINDGNT